MGVKVLQEGGTEYLVKETFRIFFFNFYIKTALKSLSLPFSLQLPIPRSVTGNLISSLSVTFNAKKLQIFEMISAD